MIIGVPPVNGQCFKCGTWSGSLLYVVQTDDVIFKCPKCTRVFAYKANEYQEIFEEILKLIDGNEKDLENSGDL